MPKTATPSQRADDRPAPYARRPPRIPTHGTVESSDSEDGEAADTTFVPGRNAHGKRPAAAASAGSEEDALLRLRRRWSEVVSLYKASECKKINVFPEFMRMKSEFQALGFQPCISLICPCGGVLHQSDFFKDPSMTDGLRSKCKTCQSTKWCKKAAAATKTHRASVDARIAAWSQEHLKDVTRSLASPSPSDDQPLDVLSTLRVRWAAVLAAFMASKVIQFGTFPDFKKLQADCEASGFRTCSSPVCPHGGVLQPEEFGAHPRGRSGISGECKTCWLPASKRKKRAVMSAHTEKVATRVAETPSGYDASAVEDEAMSWLKATLEKWFPGIEVVVMPEFRHADFCVRFGDWPMDTYLPVQLKSTGIHRRDGTQATSDVTDRNDGGRASFGRCDGYGGLVMVFVKARIGTDGGVHRTLWWAWGEYVNPHRKERTCGERVDGRLSSINPSPSSWTLQTAPPALLTMLRSKPERRCCMRELWLDVRQKMHRKELAGMLALQQVSSVLFPTGNQTSIDCCFDGKPTQVKTYNILNGCANAGHSGTRPRPYSSSDGIEQLVEVLIVKSNNAFYLVHAVQQRTELIAHRVFAHEGNTGKMSISVPLGKYRPWLTGQQPLRAHSKTDWLVGPEHGFRPPVRLNETEYLARELLEEVSWTAVRPDLMPV